MFHVNRKPDMTDVAAEGISTRQRRAANHAEPHPLDPLFCRLPVLGTSQLQTQGRRRVRHSEAVMVRIFQYCRYRALTTELAHLVTRVIIRLPLGLPLALYYTFCSESMGGGSRHCSLFSLVG
jgi:hypothetical protein